jgi:hypothetical protein
MQEHELGELVGSEASAGPVDRELASDLADQPAFGAGSGKAYMSWHRAEQNFFSGSAELDVDTDTQDLFAVADVDEWRGVVEIATPCPGTGCRRAHRRHRT